MDSQKGDCRDVEHPEVLEKDRGSTTHADDINGKSYVTDGAVSDQSHTTEDQHETVEAKTSLQSFCQQLELQGFDGMDSSPHGITSRLDITQFSNSSIVSGSENRNTHRKTGADMRILASYMHSLNEVRAPENIPPSELDKYLSSFFLVVRKSDGSEYEPCSLRAMLASIERYLRQKNYPSSLTRDSEFANMRNVLKLKQQMLRSLGKGQKSVVEVSQSACVREGKITRLFQSHEMGPYNPNSIIFSLCFFFCMYLKLRKSTEHKKLLWGDIMLCQDYNNREYLTFSPQMLSRIHASQRLNHRLANARVWAEPDVPERDPVALYKFYAQKRPPNMNQPYAPFYLGLNTLTCPMAGQNWYRPAAMGINKLNEMVRQIRDLTGLKSTSDTSPVQYLPPNSQDFSFGSELSNASSEPSSSRDGHIQDGLDFEGRDETPATSPQLTIDIDETFEPSASTSADQPLTSAQGETDSSDEGQVFRSPYAHGQEEGQSQQSPYSDNDDPEDFIGVEQAKELVVDIIQRMDFADIVHFDHWLKTMHVTREPITGQVICKDTKETATNPYERGSGRSTGQNVGTSNADVGMNILLNISLTPHAMRGQGPVTVQATTVGAHCASFADVTEGRQAHADTMADFSRGRPNYDHHNGGRLTGDSPLDLAINSLRAASGSPSDTARPSSRLNSSGRTGPSVSSSLSSVTGDSSPAKQRKLASDFAYAQTSSVTHLSQKGTAQTTAQQPQRPSNHYEGSRRKPNPAFLTHIKPKTPTHEVRRAQDVSSGHASSAATTKSASGSSDGEVNRLPQPINLKQEAD